MCATRSGWSRVLGVMEPSPAAAECGVNLDSVPGSDARLEPLE